MALTTSPPIYVGLLLLLSSGVAPFQLRTPGMCSARQATFLSEPPTLMCTEDASAVEAAPAKAAAATDASLLTTLGDARTILTCAKCKAAYPIDAEAFGSGQRVKCLNCEHEWCPAVLTRTSQGFRAVVRITPTSLLRAAPAGGAQGSLPGPHSCMRTSPGPCVPRTVALYAPQVPDGRPAAAPAREHGAH